MAPQYEIFRKVESQAAIWVETATNLEDAKARIAELRRMFPGDYFIFDTQNICFVVPAEDCGER